MAVPSQATGVTVSASVRSGRPALMVNWTAPQSDVSISQYHVQYRRSGATSWSNAIEVPSLHTSYEIHQLVASSEYLVRVRALSVIGHGNWSEIQSKTTYSSELSFWLHE